MLRAIKCELKAACLGVCVCVCSEWVSMTSQLWSDRPCQQYHFDSALIVCTCALWYFFGYRCQLSTPFQAVFWSFHVLPYQKLLNSWVAYVWVNAPHHITENFHQPLRDIMLFAWKRNLTQSRSTGCQLSLPCTLFFLFVATVCLCSTLSNIK